MRRRLVLEDPARQLTVGSRAGQRHPGQRSGSPAAGYHRIGGTAQGVSLAVPDSWVSVNFAQQTLQQAVRQLSLHGVSATSVAGAMRVLIKLRAVYAIDAKSMIASPEHVTNISAYCGASGITETGSDGLPFLGPSVVAELKQAGAGDLRQTNLMVGGIPAGGAAQARSSLRHHAERGRCVPQGGARQDCHDGSVPVTARRVPGLPRQGRRRAPVRACARAGAGQRRAGRAVRDATPRSAGPG